MRGRRSDSAAALAAAIVFAVATGCGVANETPDRLPPQEKSAAQHEKSVADTVPPSRCPADLPSCRSAEGRITYVEPVDPDGDGDAHFVIVDPQGITLPGLTAIDVRRGLRPDPLPDVGDLISAAGPVQTGSYGQSQIHALELHVASP